MKRLRSTIVIALLAHAAFGQTRVPAPTAPVLAPSELPARYRAWLQEVDPLISVIEHRVFRSLTRDHHREAFIREFWRVRDPYPQTVRNELKDRWDERIFVVQTEYGGLEDDRARILLVHGPPDATLEARCSTTRIPVEIWLYESSDVLDFRFLLVFLRRGGQGPARLWAPKMVPLERVAGLGEGCINGERVAAVVRSVGASAGYADVVARVIAKPRPRSEEWVATFAAYTTEVPRGSAEFGAEVSYSTLGRRQSRTVVQGVIEVQTAAVGVGEFAGFRSLDFLLTGEVVRGKELFESFRYKFGFPAGEVGDPLEATLPMVFQRRLRPGDYRLLIKLEDLNSGAFFQDERVLEVSWSPDLAPLGEPHETESMQLFREATAAMRRDDAAIRLVAPGDALLAGQIRFDTITAGPDIDHVVFALDDLEILTKNRPPFSVEIDLGPFPRLRRLRVEARNSDGLVVADDEVLLNAGENRFALRLVEPKRHQRYDESLQAEIEVDIPPGKALERVEFFLEERLVATLYQPPFAQPIRLPQEGGISYVRAVAHLLDGATTEDLVFINSPDYLESIDVQLVELYAAALDDDGRLVEDLGAEDFLVLEDGVEQNILRFERVQNLPIHTIILIDNSASMIGAVDEAKRAALRFFERSLEPRDRAAVVTFNRFPDLAVKFTNDRRALGTGLQGLVAEGQTALYDSLMFSLYYFTGITGQRAVLLLSDGKDEVSRFAFDETIAYARRAGVTLYTIGLKVNEGGARHKLVDFAKETGGRSYFIDDIDDLGTVYDLIERDLRSQYLIAYQSQNRSSDGRFRSVELKVGRPRTTVRTLTGYYP